MGNILTNKIDKILEDKSLSRRKLAKLIDDYEGNVSAMIRGKRPFTDSVKEKILPILEISKKELELWIFADKYPKEVFELAIRAKKSKMPKKSVLTTKIDEILKEKNMSRTQLAKKIGYSQSGLNRMIVGKIAMSQSIITRIAPILEIDENTIKSWILADKYSIKTLESALMSF